MQSNIGEQVLPRLPIILVVDDDQLMRMSVRAHLTANGFQVDAAAGAAEAIGLLAQKHYDLVLTDLNLGNSSGIEVVRHARATLPRPGILVFTGSADAPEIDGVMVEGADRVLIKPCALAEISTWARARLGEPDH